jgi:hypothetical protein
VRAVDNFGPLFQAGLSRVNDFTPDACVLVESDLPFLAARDYRSYVFFYDEPFFEVSLSPI